MRKQYFLLVLVITAVISCSSAPNFSDVTGKEWKLIEINIDGRSVLFDRDTLADEDAGDIFTMNFDAGTISGTGAPNRYSAPYTLSSNQGITIMLVRSTLMAAIRQPEKLREQDFFVYMQNVNRWNLVDTNLELYSKTENNAEVKLVFSL